MEFVRTANIPPTMAIGIAPRRQYRVSHRAEVQKQQHANEREAEWHRDREPVDRLL
jgi:hypothetical protein